MGDTGQPFTIGESVVPPGATEQIELPVSRLPSGSWMALPVAVVNGNRKGKTLWLCAAVHGDELNGIEIIRGILLRLDPKRLHGTVVAVPMVNGFGVMQESRYLPDRRDLNRSFPGSSRGSLASRLASLLTKEVIEHSDLGIDFHTGSNGRTNLPQIRVNAGERDSVRLANAFGAPVVYHAKTRKGSLRWACSRAGIPSLLYEGGEALRFDDSAIQMGIRGTLRVMQKAGMLKQTQKSTPKPFHCYSSQWIRAKAGGIFRLQVRLGQRIKSGQIMGVVCDAFNTMCVSITAPENGIVIGLTQKPLVNSGDALVHLARIGK